MLRTLFVGQSPGRPLADGERPLVIPHASGRCRWWDDPANVEAVRLALRVFLNG